MKNIRGTLVLSIALALIIVTGVIFLLGQGHKMTSSNHQLMFKSHDMSNNNTHSENHNSSDVTTGKEETVDITASEQSSDLTAVSGNSSTQIDDLSDIEIVKYTVKPGDTLWKIATTYMPSYNAYPVDDKEGVIAYIAKENKLKKGKDDRYIIYSGTTITIPKQKDIVLNNNTKTTTAVSNTTKTNTASNAKVTSPQTTTTPPKETEVKTTNDTGKVANTTDTIGSSSNTSTTSSTANDSSHSEHSGHTGH